MKKIICDFEKSGKTLRPQQGMCNYPPRNQLAFRGAPDEAGAQLVRDLFEEAAIPVIRIKDPRNRGYGKACEISSIFRDYRKDENDPASYFFPNTTKTAKATAECGVPVIYRLGIPRELYAPIFGNLPSAEKLATIMTNIVRNLNDGWNGGAHTGIKYWEIMDRADDPYCFRGTYEDYYLIYEAAARRIKALHPRLKVGGPGASDCGGDCAFLKGFLAYIKKNDVPCDFISWHFYGEDPAEALRQAKLVRQLVFAAKLKKRPDLINTEWNCMTIGRDGRYVVPNARNIKGAAFDAAFMINMQRAGMDMSLFYDCQMNCPWGSLVYPCFFKPYKPLYSFAAFGRLFKLGTTVQAKTVGRDVYALAVKNGEKKALLAAVFTEKRSELCIYGMPGKKKISVLDDARDLKTVLETADDTVNLKLSGYSVLLAESAE